ncbi:hypothetical protein EVAR_84808_1 [Eumeta japonica]|uniref:Uncharacterized protein n=1 Tax=Eumeta variegata TaxID=151549 RepID=A0A4C1U8B9_EUMVA|nr:hypothetical protein EVAR_84808_1 [Eumeta japonica]
MARVPIRSCSYFSAVIASSSHSHTPDGAVSFSVRDRADIALSVGCMPVPIIRSVVFYGRAFVAHGDRPVRKAAPEPVRRERARRSPAGSAPLTPFVAVDICYIWSTILGCLDRLPKKNIKIASLCNERRQPPDPSTIVIAVVVESSRPLRTDGRRVAHDTKVGRLRNPCACDAQRVA